MKVLIRVLLLLSSFRAIAAEADIPHVTAFGTAITKAKPDMLLWNVTVVNKGGDLAGVSELHARHTEAVLRFLNQKKLLPEETQTSGMRIAENREYRGNAWVKEGYVATTQVTFTMRNLADYKDTWIQLSRLDGIGIDSVTWDAANRIELQNSTRIDALRTAKIKAEQMAATLGAKIAEPLAIEEVQEPWYPTSGFNVANGVSTAPGADDGSGREILAPGSVNIRIKVRVVYRLVGR